MGRFTLRDEGKTIVRYYLDSNCENVYLMDKLNPEACLTNYEHYEGKISCKTEVFYINLKHLIEKFRFLFVN